MSETTESFKSTPQKQPTPPVPKTPESVKAESKTTNERKWGRSKIVGTTAAVNVGALTVAAGILFWPQEREETVEIGINCPDNASNAELKSYSKTGDLASFVISCTNGETTAKPEGYDINDPSTTNPKLSVKLDVSDKFIERVGDDTSPEITTRSASESEVIIDNVKDLNSFKIQAS